MIPVDSHPVCCRTRDGGRRSRNRPRPAVPHSQSGRCAGFGWTVVVWAKAADRRPSRGPVRASSSSGSSSSGVVQLGLGGSSSGSSRSGSSTSSGSSGPSQSSSRTAPSSSAKSGSATTRSRPRPADRVVIVEFHDVEQRERRRAAGRLQHQPPPRSRPDSSAAPSRAGGQRVRLGRGAGGIPLYGSGLRHGDRVLRDVRPWVSARRAGCRDATVCGTTRTAFYGSVRRLRRVRRWRTVVAATAAASERSLTGSIRLKASPNSAKVYIDGTLMGTVDDFDGFERALGAGRRDAPARVARRRLPDLHAPTSTSRSARPYRADLAQRRSEPARRRSQASRACRSLRLATGVVLLVATDRVAAWFGVPVPTPDLFVKLNALFLIAVGLGYLQPMRDPGAHRWYLWIFGPTSEGRRRGRHVPRRPLPQRIAGVVPDPGGERRRAGDRDARRAVPLAARLVRRSDDAVTIASIASSADVERKPRGDHGEPRE